ncbi:MAG: molybdopterin dehydrogenase FAD-binding protein [Spirochaetes bacterium]|nr:MAG: molybdopterin dehydrogenase FAD-binding protein [Spirochaetota bacterium]
MRSSEIHVPKTLQEALSILEGNSGIQVLAGGSELVGGQYERLISFPEGIVSIAKLRELRKTQRTEQFLEVGACTTLTGLLSLPKGTLPSPLREVIGTIGNLGVRNIGTIGGNLCSMQHFMDLWPFLACMDAQIEIKSSTLARWASVYHLADESGSPFLPPKTLITRVRIPLVFYNFVFYKKIGPLGLPGDSSALFVCLASIKHGKVDAFRLIFSGAKAFRIKDLEMMLLGRKLDTPIKEVQGILQIYRQAFARHAWYDGRVFNNTLEECFGRMFSS